MTFEIVVLIGLLCIVTLLARIARLMVPQSPPPKPPVGARPPRWWAKTKRP